VTGGAGQEARRAHGHCRVVRADGIRDEDRVGNLPRATGPQSRCRRSLRVRAPEDHHRQV